MKWSSMSQQLISRSADLKRLRDEGYAVEIKSNHLIVNDVPYVNAQREVKRGTLVSVLTLAGDRTAKPRNHVVHFVGEQPCHKDGSEIGQIKYSISRKPLAGDITVDRSFSNKPNTGYKDYYEKMTTYVNIIASPAEALDPEVTPRTFPAHTPDKENSVFNYLDTASSRAGIGAISEKLEHHKVAIVGLGGTGSYILDLVVKTPVKEIHLFDGDKFSSHNAFRSPGAASVEELNEEPKKVSYFKKKYAPLRRGITTHDVYINDSNVNLLKEMDFVFLSLDRGEAKKLIVERLEEYRIPFIDVGMGLYIGEGSLGGLVRVTCSTDEQRDHVRDRISFSDNDANNEYTQNIQIADLNALNAALAVVKWKKLCGFYLDLENEHSSVYTIDGNALRNEDQPQN